MSNPCERFRERLPRSLLGDLAESERQALERHLAECPACRNEDEQYHNTLRALRCAADVAPPRHFFVYPQALENDPWRSFRRLSAGWRAAIAAAAALMVFVSLAALARLEVRVGDGVFYAAFRGRIPAGPPASPAAVAPGDGPGEGAQRALAADREWVRALRAEMAQALGALSEEQRRLLRGALLEMEKRFDRRIELAARSLREEAAGAQERLYRALSLERHYDWTLLNARLDRLAASNELKAGETDAILETLLLVADWRLGNTPGGQR